MWAYFFRIWEKLFYSSHVGLHVNVMKKSVMHLRIAFRIGGMSGVIKFRLNFRIVQNKIHFLLFYISISIIVAMNDIGQNIIL